MPRRLAAGTGAVVLTDLITGMTAYSVIVLSSLWFFAWSWIRIAAEAAARGVPFGTPTDLQLAWIGLFVTLPAVPVVIFLAVQAYRLPLRLAREARNRNPGLAPPSSA